VTGPDPQPTAVGRARAALGRLPLRTRVGVLAALGVGLAVAITSVAAYATVRNQLQQQRDEALLARAHAAVSTLGDPRFLAQVPSAALGAADLRIAIIDSSGNASAARGALDAPPLGDPELAVARGTLTESVRTGSTSGGSYRVVAVPTRSGTALVLAQSTAETDQTLDRLGLVLLLVGGTGVALAAYAGLVIARTGLRPVQELTAAAERVAETGRLEPIEVSGSDELARLTRSFNAMLAALAASRDRQRTLVADAGHELRTPLTSLRTNLDLLAQSQQRKGLSDADRRELLDDVRAQVGELSDLVGDLVELARDDAPAPATEPVELADVVARAVERVARRAPGVRFATTCDPWVLDGDAASLERAVTNLLDNAAKWSPAGGTVTTTLHDGLLTVTDEGPGISEEDLPHVFDRFYRSSAARALPGSGLGLAIARQAVERHGGSVEAGCGSHGGTTMTARFPAASSRALG
jgi:two-component system, OmpR family, sensor histidine kinase MprB